MAKKEKFTIEEIQILKDVLKEHSQYLSGSASELKNAAIELIKNASANFNGDVSEINRKLNLSSEYSDSLEDVRKKASELTKEILELSEYIKKASEHYGVDEKTIKSWDELLLRIREINKELNLVNNSITEAHISGDVEKETRLNVRKTELETERSNTQAILNSDIRSENYSRDSNIDGNEVKEHIDNLEVISEKNESINNTVKNTTASYKNANETLKEQNEALKNIAREWKIIKTISSAGFEKWKEIDEKVFTVGRQMGLSTNQLKAYQQNVLNNYDELASKLGMTFEELFRFQEQYSKNTGRAIILSNEQVESLATMSKLVGEVATNEMVKNMDDFGASTETASSYLALNMARARSQGLDAQKASETFAKNVKLAASHNFKEGVNGISKMTLLSQKLKFNMDSIANAADKFETIEGAIGTAANLQMLGGGYAAQFGNPLEAMNMAMLDMEGFTNKIVDTFSGKAIFNRETGQVEMSAIDKRLMKESAKQLGISYDEAWNIASQQAKIGDIERQINKTQNFSEEDISWITSNSQYNAETKQHQVTFFENGEQKTVDVSDLTAKQLAEVKKQAISEKAIQGDVQGIHSILKAYAQKEMGDSRSWNEMQKGWKESAEINVADMQDLILQPVKDALSWITDRNWWEVYLGLHMAKGILGPMLKDKFDEMLDDGAFDGLGRRKGRKGGRKRKKSGGSGSSTSRSGSKIFKGGIGRSLNRLGVKTFGKTAAKTLTKGIPIVGGLVEGAMLLDTWSTANKDLKNRMQEIDNDSTLSDKEKAQQRTEARREANKEKGGGIGSTGGAVIGGALGMIGGPIGAAIGATAGAWIGDKVGSFIGDITTSDKEKAEKEKKQEEDVRVDKVQDKNTILSQIRDYNQLIYELLLNRYSMVSESVVNNNSSLNQRFVQQASKQLGINEQELYNHISYSQNKVGFTQSNVSIDGNTIRTYNNKEYDLTNPQQRRDYEIIKLKDRIPRNSIERDIINSQIKSTYYNYKDNIPSVYYNNINDELYPNIRNNNKSVINNSKTNLTSFDSSYDNIMVKDVKYNNVDNVTSKPIVGEPTWIKNTVDFKSPSYKDFSLGDNKIDLNVSGTIKLTTDRGGNSIDIDLNKLLSNSEFVSKLTDVITNRLSENANGGRLDKNCFKTITHSSGRKEVNG